MESTYPRFPLNATNLPLQASIHSFLKLIRMNTVIATNQMGASSYHPKLIEQLKRYNISYQEIKEGNTVTIQIKPRLFKNSSGKDQPLRD